MAATAPTEVFRPAGNTCCSDQPPASNDVESCSAPLRGLAIRCQKRAVLFPRRHGLPTCENCAWGGLGGRQQRARFAYLGLRTASRLFCPLLIAPRGGAKHRTAAEETRADNVTVRPALLPLTALSRPTVTVRSWCLHYRRKPHLPAPPPHRHPHPQLALLFASPWPPSWPTKSSRPLP